MNTLPTSHQGIPLTGQELSLALPRSKHLTQIAAEITVMWNDEVMEVLQKEIKPKTGASFTIGEQTDCDFPIPPEALGGRSCFTVASWQREHTTIGVLESMTGQVTAADGRPFNLSQILEGEEFASSQTGLGEYEIDLGPKEPVVIKTGCWTFRIRTIEKSAPFRAPFSFDWRSKYFIGVSLALHAVVLTLVNLMPPNAYGLYLDSDNDRSRFAKVMLSPPELRQEIVPEIVIKPDEGPDGNKDAGEKHVGDDGQAGDRTAKRTNNRFSIKGNARPEDWKLGREQLKEMATTMGILGKLDRVPTSPFGATVPVGGDPENHLASLIGDQAGPAFGMGGLGIIGDGRGGGGTGEGTLGVNLSGLIGAGIKRRGGGNNTGFPPGSIRPDDGNKKPHRIILKDTGTTVHGGISKEVIRRIVRRQLKQVQHCYQKGLASKPDLSGRVPIKFTIDSRGVVQLAAVAGSTLDDAQVEQCLVQVVKRLTFPVPRDSEHVGITVVTYPFILQTRGE